MRDKGLTCERYSVDLGCNHIYFHRVACNVSHYMLTVNVLVSTREMESVISVIFLQCMLAFHLLYYLELSSMKSAVQWTDSFSKVSASFKVSAVKNEYK